MKYIFTQIAKCQNCEKEYVIKIQDAYATYLKDYVWKCPHCKKISDLDDYKIRNIE